MDKTLAGILGAMGALAAATPSHAAASAPVDIEQAMSAHSYADLLRPIPNASAVLRASSQADQANRGESSYTGDEARIQTVQYHDHHHHHHHHYRRHHHRRVVVAVPVPHHHHHHHDASIVIAPRL